MKVRFGSFTIDGLGRRLMLDGRDVPLTPKAFEVLLLLVQRRPEAVRKDDLLNLVWPDGAEVGDASLTVVIAEIRKALGDESRSYVRTVQRFGYAFSADAEELAPPATPRRPEQKVVLAWGEQRCALGEGEHIIGSDPAAAVWVDVRGVSRRHARLTIRGEKTTIEDLGSTNGTFVDDEPVRNRQRVLDGQRIQFGPLEVRFRMQTASVPTERIDRARRTR